MVTRPRGKLELIIITLLFSLIIYLIFSNREYERLNKIEELNKIIKKQEQIIKQRKQLKNLDDLGDDIKNIKEIIEKYHHE